MERLDTDARTGVALVADLFRGLNDAGIPYCHWKSNEHLQESLRGLTDLDVLVDRGSAAQLQRVLDPLGFKRFESIPLKTYPGIEDFLASDPETGRLIHLHLHWRLTLGEKHLKGYRLPWESELLSSRSFDSESGVFVADPNIELLLLLVRSALKLRSRDRLRAMAGRPVVDADTLREYRWLKQRVDVDRFRALSERLLGATIDDLLAAPPSFSKLSSLRRRSRPALRLARTYGPVGATWRRWTREMDWAWSLIGKRMFGRTSPIARTNPRGGVLIVTVGCDGSGKSTLRREVVSWLSQKLDVVSIYFGSGDGPSSLLRWPFKLAVELASKTVLYANYRRRRAPSGTPPSGGATHKDSPWYEETFRVLYALVLSREKRLRLRRAARLRNLGIIVICDRYPQNQVMGFNDGPLLSHLLAHRAAFVRALARWEAIPYAASEAAPPDLVIKLHVTPEIARSRKPDMDEAEVMRRIQAVKTLRYPPSTRVVEIDADQPLDRVLDRAKRSIWREL